MGSTVFVTFLLLIAFSQGVKVSYNCSELPTVEVFITSATNPSSKSISVTVTSLVGIQDEAENRTINEEQLRKELNAALGWKEKDLPYLKKAKEETKNIKVDALKNAIFIRSVVPCFENSDEDQLLFWVSAAPFQYNPPILANCKPKDQYLPVPTFSPNESLWFQSPAAGKKNPSVILKNFGYSWKTQQFHHLTSVGLLAFLIKNERPARPGEGLNISIPESDPYLVSLKKNLVEKFSTIKDSPVTGATWKNETFYDPAIRHGRFRRHTTDVFIKRLEVQPNTAVRVFQLVGTCGDFTVYTGQVYQRVYDLQGSKCIGFEGARPGTAEDCKVCENIAKCADDSEFVKNHLEYDLWVD